ncbi:MAG: hypothetical protein V3R99_11510, partial [Thermoguttaceae bacterium]
QPYVADYLVTATFQHFISLFEDFFFDLLRLWLSAYPKSLEKRQVDFKTVLDAGDKHAITRAVVDKELNELKYKKLEDWFEYAEGLVSLGCPTAAEIETLAEIKASRDILVHNKGIANTIYAAKAGKSARYTDGETLEVPENYHRESWEMITKIVRDVSEAAAKKAK